MRDETGAARRPARMTQRTSKIRSNALMEYHAQLGVGGRNLACSVALFNDRGPWDACARMHATSS